MIPLSFSPDFLVDWRCILERFKGFLNTRTTREKKTDRIEENWIVLDGLGSFPKRVVIFEPGKTREYELRKTSKGKYQLL